MSQDRHSWAPCHPDVVRRSLVLWTGYRSGLDLSALDRRVVGAIAMPLKHAAADAAVIATAQQKQFGVVLPGQAWINQLAMDHHGRTDAFNRLGYASTRPLAPDTETFSSAMIEHYAEQFLDAQLTAGATLASTPGHFLDEELGLGREQDVALAERTVMAWAGRQAWRPPPQHPDDPPRELYASIIVRGKALPDAVEGLIELYAPLAVSGYWIVVLNGNQSRRQLAAVTDLSLGLQEATGLSAVVSGVAGIHEALLASGVAATCAGHHGMSPKFPLPPPPDTDDEGIGVPVFHAAILGVVPLGARYDEVRKLLFTRYPCGCGGHPPGEPPQRKTATIRHNVWGLQQEAWEAASFPPVIAEARLLARIRRAEELRARLKLTSLKPGWTAVAAIARSRRGGDAASGQG